MISFAVRIISGLSIQGLTIPLSSQFSVLSLRRVATHSAFIRQLRQVVGLELDAVELVVAAELLDLLLALLAG